MKFKYLYIIILILALIPFVSAAPPVADFTSNVTSGSTPLPVQFNDTSTWTPIGWSWYFGDENWSNTSWAQWAQTSTATEFVARRDAGTVVLANGSILIMGGYGGSIYRNDTWISVNNGTNWTSVNASCGWQGKGYPGTAVLSDGSILIMGGYNTGMSPQYSNDTWRSTDNGKTWTQMNASSGWKARAWMATVALPDGSVEIMAGYDGSTFRDIWRSTDNGATWKNITGASVWGTRRSPQAVLMPNNSIVLMGGSAQNDVWISSNGSNWTQVSASASWIGRERFGSVLMPDGSIIITTGINASTYFNDTWRSADYGKTWTQIDGVTAPWLARSGASVFLTKNTSIVVVGGFTSAGTNPKDVWQYSPVGSYSQDPVHTYTTNGRYNVSLRAFNADGWGDTQKPEYITLGILTASFTVNNTTGYAPFAVKFNDTSNENPTIWLWNFTNATGNNTPTSFSNAQNVTYTFGIGNFSIKLTASNFAGNSTSAQNTWINVSKYPPLTSFISNYTTPGTVYPLVIKFNDTTLYLPTTWNWSFGDGRWLNTTNPSIVNTTYQYAVAGIYNISLLTNNTAGSNISTKNDYINLTSDDDANLTVWTHMNGTNGSTTFVSEKGIAWAANGGAQISTLNPKYGGASGWFPSASNSYISSPNSSAFQFGTGDFTIEFWVNVTTVTGTNEHMISKTNNPRNQGWGLDRTNSTAGDSGWDFYMGNDSAGQAFFNAPIPNKTWTHIAVERISGTLYLYINGNLTASKAGYNTNYDTSDPMWIGRQSGNYFNGYIDEFRISKIARWKSNFTPPYNEYRGKLENYNPDINPNSTFRYKTDPGGSAYVDNVTGTRNRTVQIQNVTNASYVVGAAYFNPVFGYVKSVQLNLSYYPTGMTLISSSIDNVNGIVEFNISKPTGFSPGTNRASIIDYTFAYINYTDGSTPVTEYFAYGYLINGTTGDVYGIRNFLGTPVTYGPWNFTANFTANNLTTPMGLPVEFISTFNGSYPNRWNWSYSDGYSDNGTASTVTHTFTSTGFKTIVLTESLWQNTSVSSTMTKTNYIFVGTAPESSFTANQSFGTAPMAVEFNDTSYGDITLWNWSFGDGDYSDSINVTHVYNIIGNYTVILNVSSIFGVSNSTQYINVSYPPITNFSMSNQSGYPPLTVTFTDNSGYGPIIAWNWSFGDGNYSDIFQPTYTYNVFGIYNITLIATNIFGNNSTSHSVTVGNAPIANFTMSNQTGLYQLVMQLNDTSTNSPTSWNWSVDNSCWTTIQNPLYVLSGIGNYTINLTATNSVGNNTSTQYANISDASALPITNFTMNTSTGSAPLAVQFTDDSGGNNPTIQWNWTFGFIGLGNYSDLQNPVYTYTQFGNYTVIFYARNIFGTNITNNTINVSTQPLANFTMNNTIGNTPLPVQFTDTSLYLPNSWNWSFGDGNYSTAQNPAYIFNYIGNYTVKLNASNFVGSSCVTHYVNASQGLPPIASFIMNNTSSGSPLVIQFNDTSINSPNAWNWSFGNGVYSNERNPNYTFIAVGNYTIMLNASNNLGSSIAIRYAEVLGQPTALFTTNTTTGGEPLGVNFTDISTSTPTAWNWSFNDRTGNNTEIWFSTLQNPDHSFLVGNYTIKLNASNAYGYNITPNDYWINVSLVIAPIADFTSTSTGGPYPPVNVQFNDTSLNFPTQWNWSFGDGNVSAIQNPLYNYTFCGSFDVLLRVENGMGVSWKNTTQYINVSCVPIPPTPDERIAMRMADIEIFVVIAAIILVVALVATFIYMWAKRRS